MRQSACCADMPLPRPGSLWRRRRLFTFCSAALLLCVAVCGLWVRNYWGTDSLYVALGDGRPLLGLCSGRGTLTLLLHERYSWRADVYLRTAPVSEPIVNMKKSPGEAVFVAGFGFLRAHRQHS
jgi:hypothetical protein